ncbi:MAG TPA: MaoC family dehydratase [Terricaulis sp.]|nr:MaoC family dehydratase [Terricaulis sp.]
MQVGDELAPFSVGSVSAEAMAVLAEVLRDPNPIHLDPAAAAAAGLGNRRINQGPANFSYVINMLTRAFPQARLAGLDIAFTQNVREGDHVHARGRIKSIETKAGQARIVCDIWLDVEGGAPALKGEATLIAPAS